MESPITKNASLLTCLCMFVCFITLWSSVFALENCNFPAIYNFGDSNSDTGALSAAVSQLPTPYGETFFHMPSGRYSDGRLIIDFLANNLSLPFLSAYLDSIGANYTHGADFAIAGSTINPFNQTINNSSLAPFYLDVELSQFSQFIPRSQMVRSRGGVFVELLPDNATFSQALYTIDIGQNDIGDGLLVKNLTVQEVNATVPDLINTISLNVQALYLLGGRSFWIHNTGPIGCLAYILSALPITPNQTDSAGCGKPFNDVAQYFNQKLKEEVFKLRTELPLAAITYVDIYSIKYSFFSQPQDYGFVQPLIVCCGTGGQYNYNSNIPCGVAASCPNPSVKVVWDGIHYTDAANKAVFNQINTGKFSDPPIPPIFACHRSASLAR